MWIFIGVVAAWFIFSLFHQGYLIWVPREKKDKKDKKDKNGSR